MATILLRKLYLDRGFIIKTRHPELLTAYQKAVADNNPKIWEEALKKIYDI